jgi:hypothetical protein
MSNFDTKKIHWDIILPYLSFRDQLSMRKTCKGFRNHRLLDLTKSYRCNRGICQKLKNIDELVLVKIIKCPDYFTKMPEITTGGQIQLIQEIFEDFRVETSVKDILRSRFSFLK